jgi:stress response protein YsnF
LKISERKSMKKIEQILRYTITKELSKKYKARQVNRLNDLHERKRIAFLMKVEMLENKKKVVDECRLCNRTCVWRGKRDF